MSKKTLDYGVLILGLVTAVIHAVILNILDFNPLMLVNGLGYFVLIWAVLAKPSFLAGQQKLVHYLFMLYTLVTIVGFFMMNNPPFGPLGLIAKADEVLLLVFLWFHKDQ